MTEGAKIRKNCRNCAKIEDFECSYALPNALPKLSFWRLEKRIESIEMHSPCVFFQFSSAISGLILQAFTVCNTKRFQFGSL